MKVFRSSDKNLTTPHQRNIPFASSRQVSEFASDTIQSRFENSALPTKILISICCITSSKLSAPREAIVPSLQTIDVLVCVILSLSYLVLCLLVSPSFQ